MSSILDFYREEELREEYEEMLENKKALLFAVNQMNHLIALVEHYFETGEVSEELLALLEEDEDDE